MTTKPFRAWILLLATALLAAPVPQGLADDDDRRRRGDSHARHDGGERKEKFQEGPCKVEREWKKDGEFKEERECHGVFAGPYYRRGAEYEEKYQDGPCKIEREWKKDGTYKEKMDCKGSRHAHAAPRGEPPPWVVYEPAGPVYRRGWEPPPAKPARADDSIFVCNSRTVGAAIGGVAGGAIGSRVGKGDGRTAATIGGAIVGVLIGGAIGREMDRNDQACIGHALEFTSPGQSLSWQDQPRARQYVVVPGPVERRGDRYCRPYETTITYGGRAERVQGVACRQRDGTWVSSGD